MDKDMHEIVFGLIIGAGGLLINFVSTKIYNYFTGKSKNFLWKNTYTDLKRIKVSSEFNEIKKRTRIVVIDDEDSFPINLFQMEGYSIDKWQSVIDYGKLESGFYDIIVLDIKGVASHISTDDGLGVLENIKKTNPAQIIIAYSQHSFDLSKAKFWEMADEKIAKPSDFLKMKSIIDNLINKQFKPERYIDALHDILKKNHISEKDINILDKEIVKSIQKKEKPNWNKILHFANNRIELLNQIKTIGNTIINFFE